MSNETDDFHAKLRELQAAFALSLPVKIDDMEKAAAGPLDGLHALAHKLAGSAGTYGFPELSRTARALELTCQSLIEQSQEPSEADMKGLTELIQAMRDAAESGAAGEISLPRTVPDTSSNIAPVTPAENGRDIILVDDDFDHSALLNELLSNFGYAIRLLAHPSALADAVKERPPSAIIMDIIFPDDQNAGLTIVNSLREDGLLNCPVIFVSARQDFAARLDAIRCGADGYVVKPVNIIEMVDTLDRLIEPANQLPLRVLIVDDDPEITNFCQTILDADGLVTLAINDPMAAIAAMTDFQPDILILDIEMPNCNGFELAATIRQMGDQYLQISIVFLTAHTEMSNRMKAAQTGSVDFVSKPVDPDLLVASVIARGERSRIHEGLFQRAKAAEEKFSSMSGSANEAIVSVNDRGLIIFWNDSAARMFGYEERDIIGRPVTKLIPDQYRQAHQDGFQKALNGGANNPARTAFESHGRRQDGSEFPLDISLSSWTSGGSKFFAAIMRDVTERKRAEDAVLDAHAQLEQRVADRTADLKASETRLENLLELAPEAVVTTDVDLNIQMFNQSAERIFGYTADEIIGRPVDTLIPEAVQSAHGKHVKKFVGSGENYLRMDRNREISGLHKDGTEFPAVASIAKLQMDDETVFIAMVQDITERKATEAQLIQADKLATLGTLAAGTAHELSQPLNIIRLVVDSILYMNEDNAPTILVETEELDSIVGQVRRMAEIIDHMRVFSRKKETSTELFAPIDVVGAALNLIENQFSSADIDLQRRLPETCGPVQGSPGQLEQVILNLVANARDAVDVRADQAGTSTEAFRATISVALVDDAGAGEVRISVIDNGGGIADDALGKVFDPFFTTKEVGKGTGLGLHVSRSIVESMNGKLVAANRESGACFEIALPRFVENQGE